MDWRQFLPLPFVLWLLAMLSVGPPYFRRLRLFFDRLESHHQSEFTRLGRPSLSLLRKNIGSDISALRFISRKMYADLPDEDLVRLGESVRIRLFLWAAGIVYFLVAMPIMATYRT